MPPSVVAQPWSQLSGGQAQRCYLCVFLVLAPDVLLLDEATSALDHAASLLVEAAVRASGCAAVWVSHDDAQVSRVASTVVQCEVPSSPTRPMRPSFSVCMFLLEVNDTRGGSRRGVTLAALTALLRAKGLFRTVISAHLPRTQPASRMLVLYLYPLVSSIPQSPLTVPHTPRGLRRCTSLGSLT